MEHNIPDDTTTNTLHAMCVLARTVRIDDRVGFGAQKQGFVSAGVWLPDLDL